MVGGDVGDGVGCGLGCVELDGVHFRAVDVGGDAEVGGRTSEAPARPGDPGRTGMICAARAEGVASNPDRKEGRAKSGPGRATLPRLFYRQEKNHGQLTFLTVSRSLADLRVLPYSQLHVLRAGQAD